MVFRWRWSGQLAENQSFEIRLWRGTDPHYGAYDAKELLKYVIRHPDGLYELSFDVGSAYGAKGDGEYNWTVAIVQLDPYSSISPEAAPRKLNFAIPGGPSKGNSGGGSDGGGGGGGGID